MAAPYQKSEEEDTNEGAVYVFNGGAAGLLASPSQVVTADEMASKHNVSLRGFGYGMQGGKDVDGNGYPDVAVGAYLSSTVALFRLVLFIYLFVCL